MDGRVPAGILSVVVFALAFASDRWVPGSLLSLPLLISTLVASLTAWIGIPRLRELKMGQIIREDGPQAHLSKAGTPTMGGLLVVPVGVVIGALVSVSDGNANRLLAVAAITLAFMLIGGMDDWRSLTRQTNTGLTPLGKLVLQAGAASIFLAVAFWQGWISTTIALPMGLDLPFGWLILPLGLFVFLAESNATNLTDGLDGLAAGCGALVFSGMGLQLMLRGNNGDPALAGFCMAMAGAWIGFLVHNRNPAKVFMGDTGSLAMGASLSVIIQVWVFKATKGPDGVGRRVFRMAPLHHHFELGGAAEQQVVRAFWLVTAGLVGIGLLLLPIT